MIQGSKFIYNDDALQVAGGSADVIVELPDDVKAQLAELQELRAYKESIVSKEPEKSPEQIAKLEELEKVNFRRFAVENDYMKNDGFDQLEKLKSSADKELVFGDFKTEWEADNQDVDPEEKEQLLKEAFESQYHLNSDNKTLKARGEKMLSRDAAEKRAPLESSYKNAQEQYGREKSIAAKVPDFNKFIDSTIKEAIPETIVLAKTKDGDVELPIEVTLTKEQIAEVDKIVRTPRYFKLFTEGKPEEAKSIIEKKISGFIKINNFEAAVQQGFEKGKGVGTAGGSNVGAENLFAMIKDGENKDFIPDQASVRKQIRENHEEIRRKQKGF